MEGPIGRYARASVDYTGITNVAYPSELYIEFVVDL
ncbi:hypothetical protein ABIF63_001783 [Bradyrhizobium japonicum]|uniref:Uncharacterized protein n=1 Tax=Bradyrhizobium japonicum TaxID=375 RepID=A0ABV2RL58_BRAJP